MLQIVVRGDLRAPFLVLLAFAISLSLSCSLAFAANSLLRREIQRTVVVCVCVCVSFVVVVVSFASAKGRQKCMWMRTNGQTLYCCVWRARIHTANILMPINTHQCANASHARLACAPIAAPSRALRHSQHHEGLGHFGRQLPIRPRDDNADFDGRKHLIHDRRILDRRKKVLDPVLDSALDRTGMRTELDA